nr:transglutaminase domain-containing protein [uncultured Flavobacterium sp.]
MSVKINFISLFIVCLISNITIHAQSKNTPKIDVNELSKVLEYFKKKGDKEQYAAAVFLTTNVPLHYSEDNIWHDKKGNKVDFRVIKYKDLDEATKEFDKLKNSIGMISKDTIIKDKDVLKSEFLIKNIEMAFKTWKENPWSKTYDFNTFCEYILPYRSLTEPSQDWRSIYQQTFEKLSMGIIDSNDPVELCSKIIDNIKHFDFVLKRFDPKSLLGPIDLLFWREGNCPDLANVAIFASRSLGVATTFDYTPNYAASSNRHFWNTVIDSKGTHIPFNGNQDLPYAYNAVSKRLGKVFRETFSEQKGNLTTLIQENQIPDDFLKSKNIIDVTSEYVAVSDINYAFSTQKAGTKVSYINVFNRGKWRPLDWAKINNSISIFKNMGRDIVYLPSTFISAKMAFENYPILLNKKGEKKILKPDFLNSFSATLSRDNEYKNKYTDNNPFQIIRGEKYRIYVWSGTWLLVEEQLAYEDNKISFKKLPKNGLFLMCPLKPDFYERIFTIEPLSNLITWY